MPTEGSGRETGAVAVESGAVTRAALFGAAVASLQMIAPGAARADRLQALIMPGPVAAAHQELESDCSNCHRTFDRNAMRKLCADCHEDVREDLRTNRGFHAKRARAAARVRDAKAPYDVECRQCHSEHRGRDADIVGLDADLFDHGWTDYPLVGGHTLARCTDCHDATTRYRATTRRCFSCHETDDVHRGGLGEECSDCHDVQHWAEARFDHDKTRFALTGSHAAVPCEQCHPGARYTDTPTQCVSCHRIDDAHDGHRGDRCQQCHDVSTWKRAPFDHDRTRFPLRGAHGAVPCAACHPTNVFDERPVTCVGCHERDDPHTGTLGPSCESCHKVTGWLDAVRFDHDLTAFPLIGLHQLQPCEACHADQVYSRTAAACVDCHGGDDVHDRTLGTACASCHTPNGWPRWLFDHDTQTRYPLVGAHERLQCGSCHSPGTGPDSPPSTRCNDCHGDDDVHDGAFGRACDRCHDLDTFRNPRTLR